MQKRDLTGKRFGRLRVINEAMAKHAKVRWSCLCDCGKTTEVSAGHLLNGHTKSCGCLVLENKGNYVHGKSGSREYKIWSNMIYRCTNPKATNYEYYGGRGIRVSPDFQSFPGFYKTMGDCPRGIELDRIDSNGDYAPGNTRWANRTIQARNVSKNHLLTYRNKTQPISAWAEELQMPESLIYRRLARKWSVERTLSVPKFGNGNGRFGLNRVRT